MSAHAGCRKYANYSVLTARIFLPSTFISMPRGGRRSEPFTMLPRTQAPLPGRLVVLSGSNTVRLQGLPTIGCFGARKTESFFSLSRVGRDSRLEFPQGEFTANAQ